MLEDSGSIVGYFSLKMINGENRLDNLWIEPKFIRKGYGSLLLSESIDRAKELGWDSFRMAVDDFAVGFYESKGASVIGKVQSRLGQDVCLNHMELNFNEC